MKFNEDLVVAHPDVFQVTIGADAEFLLLASDGLWDYINRFVWGITNLLWFCGYDERNSSMVNSNLQ